MKLSDLRGLEFHSPGADGAVTEEPVVSSSAQAEEEPWGVAQAVTPSGIEIYYQAGPKREYRLRHADLPDVWETVPSASEVLQVLEKGGLSWWGMKVGILGSLHVLTEGDVYALAQTEETVTVDHPLVEGIVERLKAQKRTVNHVKGAAADRGTNVHSALELYAEKGILPDPDLYPENEAGYVRGLVAFLKDAKPKVIHSELMVASAEHGYAGRFDMVARIDNREVVTKTYPKWADKTEEVTGRWLLDLKTSKGVYASYHLQLDAYDVALVESGYEPVDHTGVIRVTDDGRYEVVAGRALQGDFLWVLEVYHAIRRIEGKS